MSIDRPSLSKAKERAGVIWQSSAGAYRLANKVTHHALGMLLMGLLVAYFVFCGIFLVLRYGVLPNIDRYKPQVEQIAGNAVGRRVSIGTIHASWHGLRPKLLLNNVVVHSREGDSALSLPRVSATLSWWSVPVASLRLYSLEISRPDMDIDRDKEGNLYVAGILIDSNADGDGKGLDWILSQRELVIRDGWVRWNDAKRGSPPLVLGEVNFVMRNHWLEHRFALSATPPAELAAPIDIRADFSHPPFADRISDVSQWTGTLYADWRNSDLAAWKTYFDYPIEVNRGRGAVRAWLNFDRAAVADFTADLTLSDVSTRLRQDLQQLNLASLNGRISASERAVGRGKNKLLSFGSQGHAIVLSDFSLETSDGLKLAPTTISEIHTAASPERPEQTEIHATSLDLHTLSNFVRHLPLPDSQRQMLTDLAPRGMLKDFSARWQGSYPDITAYSVKGKFSGLAMKAQVPRPAKPKTGRQPAQPAVPGVPGFENLTGQVDANERGGVLELASTDMKVNLPGYFPDPALFFERLNMDARWNIQNADQLEFRINKMDFMQEGIAGSISGRYAMRIGGPSAKSLGMLDMNAKIDSIDFKKIGRYLPAQTPQEVRAWLTGALLDGKARDVALTLKGDMADFPFRAERPADKPKGVFSVTGKIENGKLNYAAGEVGKDGKGPLWPVIDVIDGSFAVDRARLEIKGSKARTQSVVLSDVIAVIPDLMAEDQMLNITGNAVGPLQDFLRFTINSPVGGWIGHFTDEIKASGNAKLQLKLQLPLAHLTDAKVQGTLQFAGNDVILQNYLPPILHTVGELKFHEQGFEISGIKGGFLGGALAISGGTQRDGTIAVKADGSLSVEGLRRHYPAPAMERVLQRVKGNTRYTALISIKKQRPEIIVESSLQGMALDFPSPLNKTANENLPLKVELTDLPSDDPLIMRDEIKLALGSAISARYLRQKSIEKNASWQVVRGGIGVHAPPPIPDNGLVANVSLRSLNLDAWRNSVASILGNERGSAGGDNVRENGAGEALNMAQYIDPQILAARATEVHVMGKKLDNVVIGASHQKGVWQANIDSDQASGYLTWNESPSGRGLGRVTARLASLIIPPSGASEVSDLLGAKNETAQIPALDIVAENFELMGKKFGHLELSANNASGAKGREWRINKLNITNPDASFKAAGKWSIANGESVSTLTYALDVADAGKLLERFGFKNVLRAGKGKLDGEVSWKGLPFSLDIPSLSGQLHIDMGAGQFLKVEPGAAKLLAVLSLQSLPRRLALDFRDVFSEGFAFDRVVGTASISQGVMKTDNIKMRSVSAVVLMDGSADIAKETQNLHVVVIPEINVGTASVVYGLVNPVIGIGSFLAQLFLRDPLMQAFTMEYEVSGPWKDPAVRKLDRRAAIPSTAPPVAPTAPQSGLSTPAS